MSRVRLSYLDKFVISPCNDLLIYPRSKKEPMETLPSEELSRSSLSTSFEIEESDSYDTLLVMWEILSTLTICQNR